MRDALEQVFHIDLLISFLPGLVNGLAVLPVDLVAGKRLNPVEQHILEVLAEVQVLLASQVPILEAEGALAHSQLVLVLVVGEQEEGKEADHDAIEPTHIR
jgi:hypothetical protein